MWKKRLRRPLESEEDFPVERSSGTKLIDPNRRASRARRARVSDFLSRDPEEISLEDVFEPNHVPRLLAHDRRVVLTLHIGASFLVPLIDGQRSIDEVVRLSGLPLKEAVVALAELVDADIVVIDP